MRTHAATAAQRHALENYSVEDVEKRLRIPRRTLRALVNAGFVTPARGPRNALRFSFQDLIVLRAAQTLVDANLPPRRITQSLRELRKRLPATATLSGLRIRAIGDRVVVSDRGGHWQADTGQYLLAFDADPAVSEANDAPEQIHRAASKKSAPRQDASSGDWFDRAVALEGADAGAARTAYERAIASEPARIDARINLGRLLHEAGRHAQAERTYREAIDLGARDPLLQFNLGVLLEDMGRGDDAITAYEAALGEDPNLADGHYNLALLYESAGRAKDAIRHLARYRRLTRSK